MQTRISFFVFLSVYHVHGFLGAEGGPHKDALLNRLFTENKYHVTSRPVADDSDTVTLKLGVNIVHLFELVRHYVFAQQYKICSRKFPI